MTGSLNISGSHHFRKINGLKAFFSPSYFRIHFPSSLFRLSSMRIPNEYKYIYNTSDINNIFSRDEK